MSVDECLRSHVISIIVCNVFVTSYCDRLWHAKCDLIGFLRIVHKYIENATFRTSLAFQMSVLERLERAVHGATFFMYVQNANLAQFSCFKVFLSHSSQILESRIFLSFFFTENSRKSKNISCMLQSVTIRCYKTLRPILAVRLELSYDIKHWSRNLFSRIIIDIFLVFNRPIVAGAVLQSPL